MGWDREFRGFLGRKGVKCLVRRRGPMVLTANVSSIWECSSWAGDFSGWRMPGREKARWRWWDEGGKRDSAFEAALEMESSSVY